MDHFNLRTTAMRDIAFTGASALERGVWLSLMLHSVAVENRGVIAGCRNWPEQQWIKVLGVTLEEVGIPEGTFGAQREASLWDWEGDDLHLWGYPHHNQAMVDGGSKQGQHGSKGGRPKKTETPSETPSETPTLTPKGKVREGKVREEEEKEGAHARPGGAPASLAEALTWAAGYSKGNAEMLVIDDAWVRDWFDERSSTGWERVSGGLQIPIADWQADLLRWCRRDAKSRPVPVAKKKEGGGEPAWDWRQFANVKLGIVTELPWPKVLDRIRDEILRAWSSLPPIEREPWEAKA